MFYQLVAYKKGCHYHGSWGWSPPPNNRCGWWGVWSIVVKCQIMRWVIDVWLIVIDRAFFGIPSFEEHLSKEVVVSDMLASEVKLVSFFFSAM